jgi:type I restriction enzyme R subunit
MIGKPERHTQNRVIAIFCDELNYRYVGDGAAAATATSTMSWRRLG